ncbi:MAG: type I restriction enzyme endonuclease domain-containing protein [Planctomycetota bacterium]
MSRSGGEGRSFKELLEAALRKYENRVIETAQIFQKLIDLAKRILMRRLHRQTQAPSYSTSTIFTSSRFWTCH